MPKIVQLTSDREMSPKLGDSSSANYISAIFKCFGFYLKALVG